MKIVKNHVYVALITVAAAGWVMDTFVFNHGASPASAAAAPPSSLLVEQSPATAVPPAPALHMKATLAQRFASAAALDAPFANAFAPPTEWTVAAVIAPVPATAATRPAAARIDIDAFRHAHKLTAILVTGRSSGTAVIDGAMVPLGRSYAGLTLSALTERTATLRAEGCDIVLQLDSPAEPGSSRHDIQVK